MDWGFVWMMLILKIPLIGLFWIIWWAIKDPPDPARNEDSDDGPGRRHRPTPPTPLAPRRGPHGEPALAPPPRTRTTVARSRVARD